MPSRPRARDQRRQARLGAVRHASGALGEGTHRGDPQQGADHPGALGAFSAFSAFWELWRGAFGGFCFVALCPRGCFLHLASVGAFFGCAPEGFYTLQVGELRFVWFRGCLHLASCLGRFESIYFALASNVRCTLAMFGVRFVRFDLQLQLQNLNRGILKGRLS